MKDQIDRMKRKKVMDDEYWSPGSDEGGDSLEQPTIKKGDAGNLNNSFLVVYVEKRQLDHVSRLVDFIVS